MNAASYIFVAIAVLAGLSWGYVFALRHAWKHEARGGHDAAARRARSGGGEAP